MSRKGQFQAGNRPHNSGRVGRGLRKHKDRPYVMVTKTQRKRAMAEHDKMVRSMSTMNGHRLGLEDLDFPMVVAVTSPEEIETWAEKALDISRFLKRFASKLKKGAENATQRTERDSNQGQGEGAGDSPPCATGRDTVETQSTD